MQSSTEGYLPHTSPEEREAAETGEKPCLVLDGTGLHPQADDPTAHSLFWGSLTPMENEHRAWGAKRPASTRFLNRDTSLCAYSQGSSLPPSPPFRFGLVWFGFWLCKTGFLCVAMCVLELAS